jgi:thymidylate synthase
MPDPSGNIIINSEVNNEGIRYSYGDLNDLVNLLMKDPKTRQAYLPIWFPEDTGAVHGGRVPCTLGYHFIHRDDYMDITYHIRACDALRHFVDDIYLAGRLLFWVLKNLERGDGYWAHINPGKLIMHIGSFHTFYKERNQL